VAAAVFRDPRYPAQQARAPLPAMALWSRKRTPPPLGKPRRRRRSRRPVRPMARIIVPLVLPSGNVGFASDSACDGGRGRW